MLPLKVLLTLLMPTAAVAKNVASGFHSLHFDVSRGSSFDTATNANARLKVRAAPDGTILTEIENEQTFYSVQLKIGSDAQAVTVLVDTGSSDLWVTDSSNPYCSSSSSSSSSSGKFRNIDDGSFHDDLVGTASLSKLSGVNKASVVSSAVQKAQSIDCTTYGTFDPSTSTTYQDNSTEFYILYGDSTFALGTWSVDNFDVGGVTVDNLSFAVANQTNSTVGVLGIGLEGLETTYSGSLAAKNGPYTYANLPTKMVEDGLISKRVYSLYLNDVDASSGNVLFGGVDHAKYEGTLTTIPVINTLKSSGYNTAIKLEVSMSELAYSGQTASDSTIAALLDSGTTLTYLPSSVISTIADAVGAQYSSSYGYYIMDCPSSSVSDNLTFTFEGVAIPAPITNFILQADSMGTTCVLSLMDSGDDTAILGDSFLRAAYLVYDLDNLEIGMAPVKFTDDENIEVITGSIPSASQASDYSSTASVGSSDETDLNGVLGGGISSDGSASGSASASASRSRSTGSSDDDDDSSSTSSGSRSTASSSSSGTKSSAAPSSLNMSLVAVFASLTIGLLTIC